MRNLIQRPMSLPKPVVTVLALALAALLGAFHFVTGRDFTVSAFYLLPICWACWTAGRKVGLLLAATSAASWLASDLVAGCSYEAKPKAIEAKVG